jgi:hypothetical protein
MLPKFLLALAVTAAAAFTPNSAQAENHLKVPFNFIAGDKMFPAGVYTVEVGSFNNTVILRSKDGSNSFSWITGPGSPEPNDKHVALRFDTVGSNHVLRTIQYKSDITARLDKHANEHLSMSSRLSQGR